MTEKMIKTRWVEFCYENSGDYGADHSEVFAEEVSQGWVIESISTAFDPRQNLRPEGDTPARRVYNRLLITALLSRNRPG